MRHVHSPFLPALGAFSLPVTAEKDILRSQLQVNFTVAEMHYRELLRIFSAGDCSSCCCGDGGGGGEADGAWEKAGAAALAGSEPAGAATACCATRKLRRGRAPPPPPPPPPPPSPPTPPPPPAAAGLHGVSHLMHTNALPSRLAPQCAHTSTCWQSRGVSAAHRDRVPRVARARGPHKSLGAAALP